MDEINVNDGGGLYDSVGLIDTLIVDCNDVARTLTTGNYVSFCSKIVEMVQKLSKLRNGVQADLKSKDEIIKDLKRLNNDLAEKVYGVPADRENENA